MPCGPVRNLKVDHMPESGGQGCANNSASDAPQVQPSAIRRQPHDLDKKGWRLSQIGKDRWKSHTGHRLRVSCASDDAGPLSSLTASGKMSESLLNARAFSSGKMHSLA